MSRDERGAATAELALTIPLLLSLTVGLVWLLAVGMAQIRVVDAAREAARASARGDPVADARARAEQIAPPGGRVELVTGGDEVIATASGSVRPPGGLLGFLPTVRVHARAVALRESS